jgi:hypothetical protein
MEAIELDKLTAGQIDAEVARLVFGWTGIQRPMHAAGGFGTDWRRLPPGRRRATDKEPIPTYSTDPTKTWVIEDRIAELGEAAMHAYTVTLAGMVWMDARDRPGLRGWQDWRDTWAIVRATPRQRCIAALLAAESAAPNKP